MKSVKRGKIPYMGNNVSGFVIGHLFGGSVRVQRIGCKKGKEKLWYGYGRITYSDFGRWARNGQRCGWVRLKHLKLKRAGKAKKHDRCPWPSRTKGRLGERYIFWPGTYQLGCGVGCVQRARIKSCSNPSVYANYDPRRPRLRDRFLDYEGKEKVGRGANGYRGTTNPIRGFGTRYKTRDGNAILIKDKALRTKNKTGWYFIRSMCVEGERTNPPKPQCSDGRDNDSDGEIDHPTDLGCSSEGDKSESPNPQCSDEKDNDSDGRIDHPADPGCTWTGDTSESPNPQNPQCSDKTDNDSDTKTDFPHDPGCVRPGDTSESPDPLSECSDGKDNDSDGEIDHPADPNCSSAADNSEEPDPPGELSRFMWRPLIRQLSDEVHAP